MYLIYLQLYCIVEPNITASVTPAMIVGNEGQVPIRLSCIASVVQNITSISYQFTWMRNGVPVDLLDNRIMVYHHDVLIVIYGHKGFCLM